MRERKRYIEFSAERFMKRVFMACACFSIGAVLAITFYLLAGGLPALKEVGPAKLLLETRWDPAGSEPAFGIAYIILTSLAGTALAVLLGVPVGVLTGVFLAEAASPSVARLMKPAVELLAGIPSVIYGLLGVMLLNPLIYRLELALFRGSPTHQFTGGANLISAVLVLAMMILPTVIHMSETALRSVDPKLKSASLALGASKMETIFQVLLPAARSGILAGAVLGVGRALGEAMAITLVAGSSVNLPLPFHSVRFLTTAIVSEMGYASGLHRRVLFTIGLVLFVFILGINLLLEKVIRRGREME